MKNKWATLSICLPLLISWCRLRCQKKQYNWWHLVEGFFVINTERKSMFSHNNKKIYNKLDLDSISLIAPQFGKNNTASLRFLFNTSRVSFQVGPLKKPKKTQKTKHNKKSPQQEKPNQPNTPPTPPLNQNPTATKKGITHILCFTDQYLTRCGGVCLAASLGFLFTIHLTHTYKGKITARSTSAPFNVERKQPSYFTYSS